MTSTLVCRSCGFRSPAQLAPNEQELAKVGMLENRCEHCQQATFWGLAEDYRRVERRSGERRVGERRSKQAAPPRRLEGERRQTQERRYGDMRRGERRKRTT